MTIDYTGIRRTFGAATGFTDQSNGSGNSSKRDMPEAQVWLNFGYETGNAEYPFVSLPAGIPIDTTNPIEIRGRNDVFNAFTAARNDLLKQFQDQAAKMEPGEEIIISLGEGGFAAQLRRRSEKPTAPEAENNQFVRSFQFA